MMRLLMTGIFVLSAALLSDDARSQHAHSSKYAGEEQRQIKTINGYNKEITSVAFLDNAETLVTSSGDHSVRLGNDRLDNKDFVYATALSRDGQRVIAGSQDSVVRVWDTKEKKLLISFEAPKS